MKDSAIYASTLPITLLSFSTRKSATRAIGRLLWLCAGTGGGTEPGSPAGTAGCFGGTLPQSLRGITRQGKLHGWVATGRRIELGHASAWMKGASRKPGGLFWRPRYPGAEQAGAVHRHLRGRHAAARGRGPDAGRGRQEAGGHRVGQAPGQDSEGPAGRRHLGRPGLGHHDPARHGRQGAQPRGPV